MPGLCGIVQLRPVEPTPVRTLTRMLAACPEQPGQHTDRATTAGAAIQLTAFAHASPGTSRWAGHTALLDGYLLDRGAVLERLQRGGAQIDNSATDGALLTALYIKQGPAAVAEVDGDFNLCILADAAPSFALLSSRHGTRHLYYAVTAEAIVFCSYMAALTAVVPARTEPLAVGEMFNFGYLGGERSMLKDVHLLPGAAVLRANGANWTLERCWQPRFANQLAGAQPFDDLVDAAGTALQAGVDQLLERFEHVAVPISGGLDSRAILALASRRRQQLPTCHCAWYAGEADIARQLVDAAGARWQSYDPLTFDYAEILAEGARQTEGNVHCHQFWFQPLARDLVARGQAEVLLDGYLMDVFFGDTFLVLPGAQDAGPTQRRDAINGLWRRCRPQFVRGAFLPGFYRAYEEANHVSLDEQMGRVEEDHLSNFIHAFSFANRSNRYSVAMPNAQRAYVEYGYPGLSRSLVDLYLRIPPEYKVGARFARAVLQRTAPEAAQVPWVKTGRPLHRDKSWTDRLAQRLSLRQVGSLALLRATGGRWDVSHRADLNRHFRRHAPFRKAHLDIVDDERTFSRGWIDPAGLQRLTGMVDAGWPVFFLLQSLVTTELFHRRFID